MTQPLAPAPPRDSVPGGRRVGLRVRGTVQGVGFRPFVFRLAHELGLGGEVSNDNQGVWVAVEGEAPVVEAFVRRLVQEAPPLAVIEGVEERELPPGGAASFRIVPSAAAGKPRTRLLPDVVTCEDCLRETLDPSDRRAGYPFTNCTNCGPRFSIVGSMPYDRARTTMAGFPLCEACRAEYENPLDRRFHAQPNACSDCGPRLTLRAQDGTRSAADPVAEAVAALRAGRIVALKGIGGFQLLVDAGNEPAVARLRRRKRRPRKPLALLVADPGGARAIARVSRAEADLLASPQGPIVLLERRPGAGVATSVAPGVDRLGVMLPTTPLHHAIARDFAAPLVATSGNRSDEPIAIDNDEALARLDGIADLFLLHDRPIARHVDDSVAWVLDGEPRLLRRARGWAPAPVSVPPAEWVVLAVGAHYKNSVALAAAGSAHLSQHIGDMETPEAQDAFERVIGDLVQLLQLSPEVIAHDLHPDYASTQWAASALAGELDLAFGQDCVGIAVQHHHAHLVSCLAEHGRAGEALGLVWDGTGLGTDGSIWGGEILIGDAAGYRRAGRLRPFGIPGGDAAARDPLRCAFGLLHELGAADDSTLDRLSGLRLLTPERRANFARMLDRGFRTPRTSSCGRLFDGVAALVGLADGVSYEGEAAIRLEQAATGAGRAYRIPLRTAPAPAAPLASVAGERPADELLELDWRPLVAAVVDDVFAGRDPGAIAAGFHHALAEAALAAVRELGASRVVTSGGCFQNRRLQEGVSSRLRDAGIEVLVHRQVPPNDGGIAIGQAVIAAARHGAGDVRSTDRS